MIPRLADWKGNPHLRFGASLLLAVLFFSRDLTQLLLFSFEFEHYSHILLIPVVVAYLLFTERNRIFQHVRTSGLGLLLLPLAAAAYGAASLWRGSLSENDFLSLRMAAFALVWFGAFLACYGPRAFRAAAFPVLFLALVIPMPDAVLDRIIQMLVAGSAEVTARLFGLTGIPTLRLGSVFVIPGVAIEVAKECSGIRSSLALLITSLLAGRFFLRTSGSRMALAAATVPIALLKNGIRIVTLTTLAAYVDPDFLTGRLHQQGGVVFFGISLFVLAAVLCLLRWRTSKPPGSSALQSA